MIGLFIFAALLLLAVDLTLKAHRAQEDRYWDEEMRRIREEIASRDA